MGARQLFVERMVVFEDAATDAVLVSGPPTEVAANRKACLFRNGLAVVAFAQLEEFLKSRFAEVVQVINGDRVRFQDLPERLRTAALVDASHGLSSQLRLRTWTEQERHGLIESTAHSLASCSTATFEISPLVFGAQRSNISSDSVSDVLGLFRVSGGWHALGSVAQRVGLGVPALDASFKNFAQARHNAAHDPLADVSLLDLQSFRLTAIAIALSFDAVLSRACRLLSEGDPVVLNGRLETTSLTFRMIRPDGPKWREEREGIARAVRLHATSELALSAALSRAEQSGDVLVIQNSVGTPRDWRTTAVA